MSSDLSTCWPCRHWALAALALAVGAWQVHSLGVRQAGDVYEPRLEELREGLGRCNTARQADRDRATHEAMRQRIAAQSALRVAQEQAAATRTEVRYRTKIVRVQADEAIPSPADCRLPDGVLGAANALAGSYSD